MLLHLRELEGMSAQSQKKKVLIIDDDEDILNWFRMIEKKETPYNFYFLQNELEILKVLEELRPDLIFFDRGDRSVSNLLGSIDIPIVYMSTKEVSQIDSTHHSFMRKPLQRKAVDAKIRSLFKIY